jgi:MFS family permease
MIFIGFLSIQNFQTTLNDPELARIGANSLIVLYVTFTISSMFASKLVSKIGMRKSMIYASLTYILYCGYNLAPSAAFAYIAAFLQGIGAAFLWISNGAWLSTCVQEFERTENYAKGMVGGLFNGSFFAIFQFCQVLGNLIVAIMFTANASQYTVIIVMTLLCAIGAAMMYFLKEPVGNGGAVSGNSIELAGEKVKDTEDEIIVVNEIKGVFKTLKMMGKKEFALLIPIIYATGISQDFYFAALPSIVPDQIQRFYLLTIFGTSDMIFSLSLGYLSDRIGRKATIGIGAMAHYFGYGLITKFLLSNSYSFGQCAFAAILLGLGDSVFNTQPYAIVGSFFSQDTIPAFGNFRVILSSGIASAALYYKIVSLPTQAGIYIILMTIGLISLAICNFYVKKIDSDPSLLPTPLPM